VKPPLSSAVTETLKEEPGVTEAGAVNWRWFAGPVVFT
jgi:hypothetical protein